MPPGIMVGSWHVLLLGAMSRTVALQQQVSATPKAQPDTPGLGCCLKHVNVGGLCIMSEGCAELASALTWILWKSWLWGHESMRSEPTSSQLQYLRE